MPREIIRDVVQPLGEHNPEQLCVRTECVSDLVKYNFTHFNPMQSNVVDVLEQDCNVIIASPTASGKTVAMELFTAYALQQGKHSLCLFPLKALTEEKLDDWKDPSHTFSSKKIIPITSDYVLTPEMKDELYEADIIVATSEMLDSKTRTYTSNAWLNQIGVLVVDEAHLIGSDARGPRLESAIMRFCKYNTSARIILMSATVPNKSDLVEWVYNITGRKTVLVESDYRPCILNKHYIKFEDGLFSSRSHYEKIERLKMNVVKKQIDKNADDQHLIFVGNKYWGYEFKKFMCALGYDAEFHNADYSKDQRREIEKKFRLGEIRYLISTSTLSWGCNLPARRVILAHTSYGLSPMEICDIEQSEGRSGRPKYDKEGDAYIVVSSSQFEKEKERLEGGFKIQSKICTVPNLAFNAVSEVMAGTITTKDDFYDWYKHTLAYIQDTKLTKDDCDSVFSLLVDKKMIERTADVEEVYEVTQLGKIASIMYFNPLDLYDWFVNFSKIDRLNPQVHFSKNDIRKINVNVCYALANNYEFRKNRPYISKNELNTSNVSEFMNVSGKKADGVCKIAACYYALINGGDVDMPLKSISEQLKFDLKRVLATLKMVHDRYAKNITGLKGYKYSSHEWDILYYRILYGVDVELCPLVAINGIGREYSKRLYSNGIKNKDDLVKKDQISKSILGEKRFKSIIDKL